MVEPDLRLHCPQSSSSDDIKDFTKSLRNRFKSKRYFKKHPKLGYLPVQTVLEVRRRFSFRLHHMCPFHLILVFQGAWLLKCDSLVFLDEFVDSF